MELLDEHDGCCWRIPRRSCSCEAFDRQEANLAAEVAHLLLRTQDLRSALLQLHSALPSNCPPL
jgi:hypothetical protein